MKIKWAKNKPGFTIVELLIVIVVIGILAAIVIVAYNGVQDRANDSSVQSDLTNLSKQYELFKVDDSAETYPNTAADLVSLDASINKSAYDTSSSSPYNLVTCHANSATGYSIAAISKSGKRFFVTSRGSVQEYTGSADWTTATSYSAMCSSTLSGSTVVSSGAGYGVGAWRPWTNG